MKNWIHACGFKEANLVQKRVMPTLESGKNVIVTSPTGTGKTHAFLIPLLAKTVPNKGLQAVILAPTSILSKQLYTVTESVIKALDLSVTVRHIHKKIDTESTHEIVIATPYQLIDAVFKQSLFGLKNVQTVILDEADMMLDQGFIHDLELIFTAVPERAQVGIFSATMHPALRRFLDRSFPGIKTLNLNPEMLNDQALTSKYVYVEKARRITELPRVMGGIQPFFALVFGSTKKEVDAIYQALKPHYKDIAILHGDVAPREREQLLKKARKYVYQVIVASDLAARGIDLPDVSHVVNVSLPTDPSYFIHRIGRTARVGKPGMQITLYEKADLEFFEKLKPYGYTVQLKGVKA